MNTRLLMRSSALFLGIIGVLFVFASREVLEAGGFTVDPALHLIAQILGAAWLGLAILNWMAQGNLIGGIYGKPVAMGNMTYFLITGMTLIKLCLNELTAGLAEIGFTVVHVLFAALFAYVAFTHPQLKMKEKSKA